MTASVGPSRVQRVLEGQRRGRASRSSPRARRSSSRTWRRSVSAVDRADVHDAQRHQPAAARGRRAARRTEHRRVEPVAASTSPTSGCWRSSPARSSSPCRTRGCTTRSARGKQEWERTFDAISDPIAVFDRHGRLLRGNIALAALLDRPVTEIRGVTCGEVGLCGGGCPACAVGRALAHDGPARADAAPASAEDARARRTRRDYAAPTSRS